MTGMISSIETLIADINAPLALGLGIVLIFSAFFFLVAAGRRSRRPDPPARIREDFDTAGERFEWLGGPTSEWLGI
jgi:hypothetical protein